MKQRISFLTGNIKKNIDTAFVIACAIVVVVLPFSIRITSFAMILLSACWLAQNNFSKLGVAIRTNRLLWLLCIPYLLLFLSLSNTENVRDGFWELEKAVPLILFPLIFSSSRKLTKANIHFILRAFILANIFFGIISLLYAAYQYWTNSVNLFFNFDLVNVFRSHPTYYSMYILFSLGALFYFNVNEKDEKGWEHNKWILGAIVIFFTVIIFLLAVRFVFIQFILLGVFVIYRYIRETNRIAMGIGLLVCFAAMIAFAVITNQVLKERLLQLVESPTYTLSADTMEGYNGFTTRLAQWQVSWHIIKKSPLWGVGPADVQDKLQRAYQENFLKYSYRDRLNAHNQYIQTALGLGLIGLLSLLACIVVPGILAFRQKKMIHLLFLVLFSVGCITESMLYVHKGIVFFAFFNSLFTFHLLQNNSDDVQTGR